MTSPPAADHADRIAGVLLGTAVGDALGLPREGLSPRRAQRLFGGLPLRQAFLFGRGMTSDDTEHTCLLAQSLLAHPLDPDGFARSLSWGLRFWLLGLPAGIGFATLRACLKLWLGFPAHRSGVWSAGNGPAMRSALLGVCLGQDPKRLSAFVRASTRLTHTDPRAERGALLVALAARHAAVHGPAGVDPVALHREMRAALPDADPELLRLLDQIEEHRQRRAEPAELARSLGQQRGVSGYIYRTVPVALYGWLLHPDNFREVLEAVIPLGGDADTTGAIAGALAGASVGAGRIPTDWVNGLLEWPRSVSWMRRLAERLAEHLPGPEGATPGDPVPFFRPGLLPRNLLFLSVVFFHLGRRLLPPY
jgi:ADP-ribosylglycohydrolase